MSSDARRPDTGNEYRDGYLCSIAWFRRRDAWFAEQTARTGALRCVVCWRATTRRELELHHLDYSGVARTWHGWRAEEEHEHLQSMHPACHELVHRILDADAVLRLHRTRPIATVLAIHAARARIAALHGASR